MPDETVEGGPMTDDEQTEVNKLDEYIGGKLNLEGGLDEAGKHAGLSGGDAEDS